jgi:UDP-N-acetylmuramate--alanine ligase
MNLLQYNSFYLVGIKGVAMTSLAQLLLDAGKTVQGSDTPENFPTKVQLDRLNISVDTNFDTPLPAKTDCVIYTGAHGGQTNPQVQWAKENNLPTITAAKALAYFFNQKQGIAICGVGGKSTVSAMIAWVLSSLDMSPSFSVGVGNIPGLNRTGAWTNSKYFVAEADEYVEDPSVVSKEGKITPRFAYLKPFMIVAPNLRFDHPDVYKSFAHTKEIFGQFFAQINHGGALIVNADDQQLLQLAKKSPAQVITFGETDSADFQLTSYHSHPGHTHASFSYQEEEYELTLQIPGKYNALNALAAIAASTQLNPLALTNHNLDQFRSTSRRFENIGLINGVQCYDDYAHHPHEIEAAIEAISEWYPTERKVIAFQSHTYSRTKQLFDEFVDSFSGATEVVMTDIFSSAREQADPTISSTKLCKAIQEKYNIPAQNLKTNEKLAQYFKTELRPGDVFLTLGAGDIYEVYELING